MIRPSIQPSTVSVKGHLLFGFVTSRNCRSDRLVTSYNVEFALYNWGDLINSADADADANAPYVNVCLGLRYHSVHFEGSPVKPATMPSTVEEHSSESTTTGDKRAKDDHQHVQPESPSQRPTQPWLFKRLCTKAGLDVPTVLMMLK